MYMYVWSLLFNPLTPKLAITGQEETMCELVPLVTSSPFMPEDVFDIQLIE